MKKVKNKNRKKKKNKKNKLDKEKIAGILGYVGLAVAILSFIILYYSGKSGRTLSKYSILLLILCGLLILPEGILIAKKEYEEDEPFASYWISRAFLLIMMIIGFTVAFFIDLVKGL